MEEAQKYINATVAQLFYTSNLVHDLYYRLVDSVQMSFFFLIDWTLDMALTSFRVTSNNITLVEEAPRMTQSLLMPRMVPDSTTPTS